MQSECQSCGGEITCDHVCLTVLEDSIEIRYDKTLSLACSTSALLLQPGLDVLHNHDDIMIMYLVFLSPYL